MATIPPARPSSPSIRLMALHMPATHTTVIRADRSGDSANSPKNGMRKKMMLTPAIDRMLPASTMPASLAGGDISRRSSIWPTAQMTIDASATPSGGAIVRNTAANSPLSQAASRPTSTPARMPAPPRMGVGTLWTRRASGWTTAPTRSDRARRKPASTRT